MSVFLLSFEIHERLQAFVSVYILLLGNHECLRAFMSVYERISALECAHLTLTSVCFRSRAYTCESQGFESVTAAVACLRVSCIDSGAVMCRAKDPPGRTWRRASTNSDNEMSALSA